MRFNLNMTFIGLLISALMLQFCSQNIEVDEYRKQLKQFPSKYINHFIPPNKIDHPFMLRAFAPSVLSPSEIILITKKSESYIDSLQKRLDKKNYHAFSASDTSFFIVNKLATEENWTEVSKIDNETNYQIYSSGNFAIPNFYWFKYKDNSTYTKLPKDTKLYLIESINGRVLQDSSYHESNWFMPEQWKDGLSRGIAIDTSANRLLYWLVIW